MALWPAGSSFPTHKFYQKNGFVTTSATVSFIKNNDLALAAAPAQL
jgi:hypothetical protein